MKFDFNKRKEIWDRYNIVRNKVFDLQIIAQNSVEISKEDIDTQKRITNDIIDELLNLEIEICKEFNNQN